MNFFDKCKKCSVMVKNGSGVLFQPETEEYSYILTAKHNIISENPSVDFTVLDVYKHTTLDIAIIKIEKTEVVPPLMQQREPIDKESYKFYGYPKNRRKQEKKIQNFDLNITDIDGFEIVVTNIYYAEQSEIDGCSGGGVFREENDLFYLAGIECRMDKESIKEENNTRLRFISIKAFDEIVDKYSDELIYLDDSKNFNNKYSVQEEIIDLGNEKSIILKTVPVKMEDGRVLNVSIYPVTFEEYDLFCEDIEDEWGRSSQPIINIKWSDANLYCKWLTYNSEQNISFRLPTWKEWEKIAEQNFLKENFYNYKTIEVTRTEKGSLGIYGMYGNVNEWCLRSIDLKIDNRKETRLAKGGSFRKSLKYIQDVTLYVKFIPSESNNETSFRVIRETSI